MSGRGDLNGRDAGKTFLRSVAAIVVNGSLFLPLRKMPAFTGAQVAWNPGTKTVTIQRKSKRQDTGDANSRLATRGRHELSSFYD